MRWGHSPVPTRRGSPHIGVCLWEKEEHEGEGEEEKEGEREGKRKGKGHPTHIPSLSSLSHTCRDGRAAAPVSSPPHHGMADTGSSSLFSWKHPLGSALSPPPRVRPSGTSGIPGAHQPSTCPGAWHC